MVLIKISKKENKDIRKQNTSINLNKIKLIITQNLTQVQTNKQLTLNSFSSCSNAWLHLPEAAAISCCTVAGFWFD